jgi:proline racemase
MSAAAVRKIQIVDSHTGGEPTRVVVAGGPDLGVGSLAEQRDRFRMAFDHCRSAIVNEPRGRCWSVRCSFPPIRRALLA